MKTSIFTLFLFIFGMTECASAQAKHSFWDEVQTIRRYDKVYAPPENPILFAGSSSIRKWPNLQKDFCGHVVLNRGIGGAVINDIIYFANDILFPYHPQQIILYVGENDLLEKGITADSIFLRFKNLYSLIRGRLPDIPIDYIAIKPSPSRAQYLPMAKQVNLLIAQFLQKEVNGKFIDIFPQMLNNDGKPRQELFVSDMLHMNAAGYATWTKIVAPYLIKQ